MAIDGASTTATLPQNKTKCYYCIIVSSSSVGVSVVPMFERLLYDNLQVLSVPDSGQVSFIRNVSFSSVLFI